MSKEPKSKLISGKKEKGAPLRGAKGKDRASSVSLEIKGQTDRVTVVKEGDIAKYDKFQASELALGIIAGSTTAMAHAIGLPMINAIYEKMTEDWVAFLDNQTYLNILSKQGVPYDIFLSVAAHSPFSHTDWANFLSINEKRLFSSRSKGSVFSQGKSEIILQIAQLQRLAEDVFGSTENFAIWASTPNASLEGKQPKSFLDGTFGIQMLIAELHRIEHGILV